MKIKAIGGAFIVGGTAIGAGMLALPVVSALGGFLPAIVIYTLCWLFSAATGLLLLEVCLWMPQDSNIISMAKHLLGPVGQVCAWLLYLFLFYTLTIAYVSGGGDFFAQVFHLSPILGIIAFTTIFGFVVYLGTKIVDRINFILMIGLIVTYFAFFFVGIREVDPSRLMTVHWGHAALALPVIFTSFSYQGVIPSLNTYLEHNPKLVRFAILLGTAIPFVAYIIWGALTLGLLPAEVLAQSTTTIEPLRDAFPGSPIFLIGHFFGAFALTTSFLGVTLGLLDFLADGLQIAKVGLKKVALCALIYIPPIIVASINPSIFLRALGYAGGIGCALLLGLFPILMVWTGRYKKGYPTVSHQLPGGKKLLIVLASFVAIELAIEVISELSMWS